MTISLARPNCTETATVKGAASVAPADVWDLDRRGREKRGTPHVRTLDAGNRKYGSADRGGSGRAQGLNDAFETRREKAGATIMGALFGIALIVGSAFGGAFSGGDAGFVPDETSQQMAAVIQ